MRDKETKKIKKKKLFKVFFKYKIPPLVFIQSNE